MFYRFNSHKHTAPNQSKMAGKDHDCVAGRTESVLIKIQQRWVKFTDINRGGLPKILLVLIFANLGCASVLALLCVVLMTGAEPAKILPEPDRISVPTWLDQPTQQQDEQHITAFELYLDSLENAFQADSINQIRTLKQ